MSDDLDNILFDTADRLFAELSEHADGWDRMPTSAREAGWRKLEEAGFPLALLDEAQGGLGLPLTSGLELARIAGRHALPWPLVETMLAIRFAAENGTDLPTDYCETAGELEGDQRVLAALARSLQMAGMLEAVFEMSIGYVGERQQFGRPLSRFQAIQHMLAVLAGEVAAGSAAADHALSHAHASAEQTFLSVAIARTRLGEAATKAVALSHQLHGAIGYTQEHRLHRYTTALLRYRDDFGTQAWWSGEVGKAVLAQGRDGLWPMATTA